MATYSVELLSPNHDSEQFESGVADLDDWLKHHAVASQYEGSGRTYVAVRRGHVVGFYSLAAASVEPAHSTGRVKRGRSRRPVPVIVVARLAVDVVDQGKGLAGALLKDGLRRVAAAAEQIDALAVLAHAPDQDARTFYEHFGFEPSPSDPLHLVLRVKDIRVAMRRRASA